MNHCYRLVWNRIHRCFVVAAEIARGRGKSGSNQLGVHRGAWLLACPLALAPLLGMATAPGVGTQAVPHALVAPATGPAGGTVTAGSGTIRQDGLTTTIEQHSQNLSLNWQSFNLGAASTVNFAQPNAQSIAVNRI
ncbi:MAG: ESPR-type extended signal peptide-containing protein, partial [Rhodanobacter sp.]